MKAARALLGEFRTGVGLKGQLLRGGVWSVGIKVMSSAMALALAILLARLLGPEGFGIYSFVLALITVLAIPAQLGLPNLVVRETAKAQVSERWDTMRGLWRWSSQVALAMSVVLICLGALAAALFSEQLGVEQVATLWWGLCLIPLVALGNLRGAALRGLRKVVQGQLPEFVLRPLIFIALALLAWGFFGSSLGPAEAMMLHVLAALAAFAIGAWLLLRERPQELLKEARRSTEGRLWIRSALPLSLIAGMDALGQSAGLLALGLLEDPEQVAQYRVAMQIALLAAIAHQIAKLLTAPYYARLHATGDRLPLQRMITIVSRATFALALMASAIVWAFGEPLIVSIFGEEYRSAYTPLAILMIGQAVIGFGSPAMTLLNMTGNERSAAKASAASVIIIVVSCFVLVPPLAGLGAAIATVLGLSVWQIYLWIQVKSKLSLACTAFSCGARMQSNGN